MKLVIAATNTLISLLCAVIILRIDINNNLSIFCLLFAVFAYNVLNLCFPALSNSLSIKHLYYGLNGLIFISLISFLFIINNYIYASVYILSVVISLGLIITLNEYQAFWPYENTKVRLFKYNESGTLKINIILLTITLIAWLVYLKG